MHVTCESEITIQTAECNCIIYENVPVGLKPILLIILPGNESGDVRNKTVKVSHSGQRRALSHQAKKLQEDEMIEEHDAIGQQRPPHVPHRFRLIGT